MPPGVIRSTGPAFRNVPPERISQSSSDRLVYASTRITRVSGRTPSCAIASAAGWVSIAAMTASMSETSITNPTRVGFSGSTNVRMLVTREGSEELLTLRGSEPVILVLHVVVSHHSGHQMLLMVGRRWPIRCSDHMTCTGAVLISVSVLAAQARRRLHGPAWLSPEGEQPPLPADLKDSCAGEDLNLHGVLTPQGPQPCASTNSATSARRRSVATASRARFGAEVVPLPARRPPQPRG